MSPGARILWGKLLTLAEIYNTDNVPRETLEPLLQNFHKGLWAELFCAKLIGFEDNILYIDVPRET